MAKKKPQGKRLKRRITNSITSQHKVLLIIKRYFNLIFCIDYVIGIFIKLITFSIRAYLTEMSPSLPYVIDIQTNLYANYFANLVLK